MKNETKITAQQLALFLGCEAQTPQCAGVIDMVGQGVAQVRHAGGRWIVPVSDVTPILRPVSDMSEGEYMEIQWMVDSAGSGFSPNDHGTILMELARRGFDIFDWIPAGLAIDATKKNKI